MPSNMDGSHAGQMLFVVADGQGCVDVNLGFGGTYRAPADLAFVVDGPGGCGARDTTPVNYRPPGGFENERTYHVAGVRDYDAKCVGLYLDGVLVGSKTSEFEPIQATGFVASIGRWTDGGYDSAHFKGVIDEVLVYGRPLNAAEIRRHFNGGQGRTSSASDPGIAAGWHLDETEGPTAVDFGPAGLDGTYDNTPSHVDGLVPAL
jgi:Concanavalin A-like lectin/glucanases superfamily